MPAKKLCLNCGSLNEPSATTCCNCNFPGRFSQIKINPDEVNQMQAARENMLTCWNCGETLTSIQLHCPTCNIRQKS